MDGMAMRNGNDGSKTEVFWIEDDLAGAREAYTIGDLSREFGVTLRALRFYEDKGMITPKREGLTRIYSRADRSRLEVILKGKRLGFTLSEISEMVAAHDRQGEAAAHGLKLSREKCLQQIEHLEEQKRELDAAIDELRRTHAALSSMIGESAGVA